MENNIPYYIEVTSTVGVGERKYKKRKKKRLINRKHIEVKQELKAYLKPLSKRLKQRISKYYYSGEYNIELAKHCYNLLAIYNKLNADVNSIEAIKAIIRKTM